MKSKRISQFSLIPLVLALMITALMAHEYAGSGSFDLSWHTIDGGGGTSSGGGFELTGTIGQPDAGAIAGGNFELAGGFWPGIIGAPVNTCPPDIAPPGGDGIVNVNDLLAVINGWGTCPAPCPPCAPDITGDCTVNVNDLLAVINGWGVCP